MKLRRLIVAWTLVNAVLYSILLPLWEGFDEPFHFAYVQQLANGRGLPDPRSSHLSGEAGEALLLTPASVVVKQNLPQVISYSEYFSWPAPKRLETRRKLFRVPAQLRWQPSQFINYEAHQPPLAYVLLALPERLFAGMPLPSRVALLRIIAAVAGSLLLLSGATQLFRQLGIPEPYGAAALFCLLASQMTWATIAHIGNDWLAVPIAVCVLVALNRYDAAPGSRRAVAVFVTFAAGLLTKAYFLALLLLVTALFLVRRRWRELAISSLVLILLAGPWYGRNLARYGVLTGTQESRAGIGLREVLHAAPAMNWPRVVASSVHASIWTGNNHFSTFSTSTLNLIIVTSAIALLLWAVSHHKRAEWITIAYCGSFLIALGYASVVSHIYTQGAAAGPSPWYAQVLTAPVLALAMLGASRWQRAGSIVTAFLVALFAYVLAATWALKLIPAYGGYDGRASIAAISKLYLDQAGTLARNLDSVALAPAAAIFVLAAVSIALTAALTYLVIRDLFSEGSRS
jgi:hypothetical protein